MPTTSLALYMQTQRALYAAGLPEKISALEAALRQLGGGTDGPGGQEAALSVLAQAHKLAGSGGTFGFPAVSEAAAAIEKVLSENAGVPGFPGADDRLTLEASLQALKAAAVADQPAADIPAAAPTASSAAAVPPPAGPARLLHIIDPDGVAAGQLADQLSHGGYQIRVFAQPAAADLAALQEAPAAILADITFSADPLVARPVLAAPGPVTEGRTPLLLMGAGADFQTRLAAVRAGAAGYFPHPLDVRAIIAQLDLLTSAEPTQPYRVLIIEDDEALAGFYAGVLQSAGMQTCIVTEPCQVMAPLVDFQPDLITCDIYMPQCNGIELATLIRQQPEFVRVPIIFLSAETSLDKQAQALRQGGDDFITKPVSPATLVSAAQSRARRHRSLLAAEDTLRISEERFRLVVETSLDGFLQSLPDGTVVAANQAACTMFGMSEQQIRAAGIAGLVDSTDPRMTGLIKQVSRSARFRGELVCVRGDGTRFPAEASSSQNVNSEGDVQVSVILRDITERKLLESALKQRETEFRALAENLPDPVFRYDRDCRRVYVNPAAMRVTGMTAERLLGNLPANCVTVTPEDAAKTMTAIREVVATGERRSFYIGYINSDGSVSDYQGLLVPEFDANGQVATVLTMAHDVTALRKAEQHAASFFANMPGFAYSFRMSPDGHFSFPFASPGIKDIYGLKPEDVRDDMAPLHALAHPDDQPLIEAAIAESVRAMAPLQIEFRVCRPGQPERWLNARSVPERQADGSLLWYGLMLDITERHRMEEALKASEEKHRIVFESANDGIFLHRMVHRDGHIEFILHDVNQKGCELWGHSREDMLRGNRDYLAMGDPPYTFEEATRRNRLAAAGVPQLFDWELKRGDGSKTWGEVSLRHIRIGGEDYLLAVMRDLNERKAMEEALALREQEFRSLAENLPVAVIRYDTERRRRYLNQSAQRMLHGSMTELLDLVPGGGGIPATPATIAHYRGKMDEVLATDATRELDFVLDALPADQQKHYEVRFVPEHGADGKTVGVLAIWYDITERKLAEQQIMQLNAELETRVEKRTAELTAATQELQAFSQALAHDLRQPYIAINGMSRLLEKEMAAGISERGRHYLQRIRAGVSQMNERTDSLLALAQLSRTQSRRERVDLGAMAGAVLKSLQQQHPERHVASRVQALPAAQADAGLALHLLNILLGNAWKFTSMRADAEITVGSEPGTDGEMIFFVKDNGVGFDMTYANKLFTAFQRLHAPGEFSGVGIGLATARRIVTRHGGRIWATSAPGQGACFYFTLAPASR